MPVLSKSANCRGCGSALHPPVFCPNLPCLRCGNHHPNGILDCRIKVRATVAKVRVAAAPDEKAAAAAVKAAAAAAAAAKKAAAVVAAAARKTAAVAATAAKKAAAAAKLQAETALFVQLNAAGLVVQCNRSHYRKANWGNTSSWFCPVCGGSASFCVCHERV